MCSTWDSLHTGTCRRSLFHAGSVVATPYLCFSLAALTSSGHVKCRKLRSNGEQHPTGRTPGGYRHPKHLCVSVRTQVSSLWPLSKQCPHAQFNQHKLSWRAHLSTRSKTSALGCELPISWCTRETNLLIASPHLKVLPQTVDLLRSMGENHILSHVCMWKTVKPSAANCHMRQTHTGEGFWAIPYTYTVQK